LTPNLWNRCLSQLESELSEQQLNTYIRPLQAHEDASRLCIMAPNRFVLSKVQNNYVARIREIAATIADNQTLTVDLVIGTGSLSPMAAPSTVVAETLDVATPEVSNTQPDGTFGSVGAPTFTSTPVARANSIPHASGLNPKFTFNTLVEGKSNQLGHAAAMQIGSNPGVAYNPFLIYGQSGLGKTHLMQSIGHAIIENNPSARVLYLNSEKYVVDMVGALQNGKMDEFKRYYRNLDALLIDDIQFLAKKEQSQEEFFHNFNALFEGARQIVLTCDRYPKEVPGLADRLKTRFGWGLTVAVEPPELEMRMAILNSKAAQVGIRLP